MFLTISIVSAVLGFALAFQITDYQIKSHIRLYPELLRISFKENPRLFEWFRENKAGEPPPEVKDLFLDLLHLGTGTIFRMKVWSPDGTILWSDQEDLIGRRFDDDENLQNALKNQPIYELGEAEETENIDEQNKGITLQIYTPVMEAQKTVGVMELYEANRDLFTQIVASTNFVWLLVVGSGVTIYLLLFVIFYRSYRTQKKTHDELIMTQDVTIFALAYQAELRDQETGKHLERTAVYVRLLGEELSRTPEYRSYLTPEFISDLSKAAPLHDIGKVGVPDSILLKPGKLTPEEFALMKKHCEFGSRVLEQAAAKLPFQTFLSIAIQLALTHHERWDGSGYPKGLKGIEIPISGRIMALADVYDALRSKRVYKEAFPHQRCVEIIAGGRESQFDPAVVRAFTSQEAIFDKVSKELSD
jgi:HD-GYP domain-containing protein (c-di-GMP phosphodiesterase class II)